MARRQQISGKALIEYLEERAIEPDELDDWVRDFKDKEATKINDCGLVCQVAFLMQHTTSTNILRRLNLPLPQK